MSGSGNDDNKDDVPRVRDLVRPAGTGEGEYLDDEQIAQIVHWFGLPSVDQIAEAKVPDRDETSTTAERTLRRRKEASAHVEPAMIERIERHVHDGDAVMRMQPVPERPWQRDRLLVLDESRLPTPADDEPREVFIPDDLRRDLRVRAPQASLRDLHRPETYFDIRYQPPWDDSFEPPPPDPMAPIREAIRQDYRPAAPRMGATMREALASLRALLAAPWAEAKRAEARAREAELDAGKGPEGDTVERGLEKRP